MPGAVVLGLRHFGDRAARCGCSGKGTSAHLAADTASGKVLACAFCGDCGSRVWHVNEPAGAEMSMKGGSLDQPVDLSDAVHIWTISKLPGVVIPDGAVQWERDHD